MKIVKFNLKRQLRSLNYKVSPYAPSYCLMARGLAGERIEKILFVNVNNICYEILL